MEFSVICGIRLLELCPLLSLSMTCSCISFYVVYLLNLPFRSLFMPTSPRGRQRKYSFNNIYNKLPSSFCRFLFFSIFSHLVSGVDILSNSKETSSFLFLQTLNSGYISCMVSGISVERSK